MLGTAAQASAVTTVVLGSVDTGRSGLASAINNAFSQTAGLLAVAVLGVLMLAVFGASLDSSLEDLDLPPEARQQLDGEKVQLGAAEAPEGLDAATGAIVERAIDDAFVSGYRGVVLVAAGASLASALSAALLIGGKTSGEHPAEMCRTMFHNSEPDDHGSPRLTTATDTQPPFGFRSRRERLRS